MLHIFVFTVLLFSEAGEAGGHSGWPPCPTHRDQNPHPRTELLSQREAKDQAERHTDRPPVRGQRLPDRPLQVAS